MDSIFKEFLYNLAQVLVGNHDLVYVWAGLISSCISGILMLRIYYGKSFLNIIKLNDILFWLLGVFIVLRCSTIILIITNLNKIINPDSIDVVGLGLIAGALNVYSFRNNYEPIKNWLNKKFKIEPNIEKVLNAKEQVNILFSELQEYFNDNVFIFLAELTNGGGNPKPDKPLYFTILESTNSDAYEIWGNNKHLCTNNMISKLIEMFAHGFTSLNVEDMNLKFYKEWCNSNKIIEMNYYLVGVDGSKRALMLIVTSINNYKITDNDNIRMISYSRKIKKVINESRSFFENKIS